MKGSRQCLHILKIFLSAEVTATFETDSYTVNEDAGFVDIEVLLNETSCKNVTVIVTPQVQSPVNASSM